MAKTTTQSMLDNNAARVATITATSVPGGSAGAKHEIGRGAPDTRQMQGTTMEAVPDRTLLYRKDDGS